MVDIDSMGPDLQPVEARFSNFILGKVSLQFRLHGMSIFHDIQMATYFGTGWRYSHVVGYAGSPTRTVYVDMTLTRSKVKVNLTRLLNFRKLTKPCMLAAMTAAPLRGFLVNVCFNDSTYNVHNWKQMASQLMSACITRHKNLSTSQYQVRDLALRMKIDYSLG